MAAVTQKAEGQSERPPVVSRAVVQALAANELVFAVVGPVGSGTTTVAESLEALLTARGYRAKILKARNVIGTWAAQHGSPIPSGSKLAETESLQNAGDEMRRRTGDNAVVALGLALAIRRERAQQRGLELKKGEAIEPDGQKRAFILDSLRHPHEVALLRRTYQDAFCLIAVVCPEEERYRRLHDEKYRDGGADALDRFMRRDENAPERYGQKVADTFHLADYFVDNTVRRFLAVGAKQEENKEWDVSDQLGRLVDILAPSRIWRPRPHETGMFHAFGAKLRSSCLSRQVGAALMDASGNLVATGTNEVPRAGGGVYGGPFTKGLDKDPPLSHDFRCFVHNGYCSNTREQNEIIRELLTDVEEFKGIAPSDDLLRRVRRTRIGQLIEFSRAVHAEMDALISSARHGAPTVGSRMYVTTFPCHNCARHIVSAGVDEVQYIEPYLKSRAINLHGDAIVTNPKEWQPASIPQKVTSDEQAKVPNVLFRPFTGVAPRLYRRAFYKDRDLKNDLTGDMEFGAAYGHMTDEMLRVSYAQVEAKLDEIGI